MRPAFENEIRIPWKDPNTVPPRTKGIGTQPTLEGRAADISDYALGYRILADIGLGQPRERQSEAMRKFTGEGSYLLDDALAPSVQACSDDIAGKVCAAYPPEPDLAYAKYWNSFQSTVLEIN